MSWQFCYLKHITNIQLKYTDNHSTTSRGTKSKSFPGIKPVTIIMYYWDDRNTELWRSTIFTDSEFTIYLIAFKPHRRQNSQKRKHWCTPGRDCIRSNVLFLIITGKCWSGDKTKEIMAFKYRDWFYKNTLDFSKVQWKTNSWWGEA